MIIANRGPGRGVRGDHGDQHHDAVRGEQPGDPADPAHVGVPVLTGVAEPGRQVRPDLVAIEHLDPVTLGSQLPASARAIVDFPADGSPVNQSVAPWATW